MQVIQSNIIALAGKHMRNAISHGPRADHCALFHAVKVMRADSLSKT